MDKRTAQNVLKLPYMELVDLALSYVNLTDKERLCLSLRFSRGLTQEQSSEQMKLSVNGLQNIEKAALQKCCVVWNDCGWVKRFLTSE